MAYINDGVMEDQRAKLLYLCSELTSVQIHMSIKHK